MEYSAFYLLYMDFCTYISHVKIIREFLISNYL